ncbi:hypothetical protein F5883DRAFT_717882 [Diaporthe sp. PMI_573]|nr:hypothetical protein F5883DRAFT_717882 [Diaporthaceae sp. PMI_573]
MTSQSQANAGWHQQISALKLHIFALKDKFDELGSNIRPQVLGTLAIANVTNTYNHRELLTQLKSLRMVLSTELEPKNRDFELEMGPKESFVEYLSRFERSLVEGEPAGWDDEDKMRLFERGLRSTAVGRLLKVQLEPPKTYSAMVSACLRLDSISRETSIGKNDESEREDESEGISSQDEEDQSDFDEGQDQQQEDQRDTDSE